MSDSIINLTDSSRNYNPIDGDLIQYTKKDGSVRKQYYFSLSVSTKEEEQNDKIIGCRSWRNEELSNTDYIVPLIDHPDHTATLAYRVALRDWPSTSDFPDTKPTL
tara:strand:+ start:2642 stop:2959 length:318 start_codon:yes stop_codon:yes gene_type:complete